MHISSETDERANVVTYKYNTANGNLEEKTVPGAEDDRICYRHTYDEKIILQEQKR